MIDNAAEFNELMYDWELNKVRDYIKKTSDNDFLYIVFSYIELGRDDAWLEKNKRALFNDMRLVKRELFLEWLQSNDTSPFEEEDLDAIRHHVKDPISTMMIKEMYPLKLYNSVNPTLNYIMGVDVAGGLSRDDSSITVIHPYNYKTVAVFRSNKIDTYDLSSLIYFLATTIFVSSVIVIERNSYGKGIIDNLRRTDISQRLYYEYKHVEAQQRMKDGFVTKTTSKVKHYGVNTDVKSRDLMINEILRYIVMNDPECVVDREIYNDIKGLQYKTNGKIEHGPATKDDGLFSYLVARYITSYGTNLRKFIKAPDKSYDNGIENTTVKSQNLAKFRNLNNDNFSLMQDLIDSYRVKEINNDSQQNNNQSNDVANQNMLSLFDSLNNTH